MLAQRVGALQRGQIENAEVEELRLDMLIHLVLLKPRPDLTEAERRSFTTAFERAVREIPTVRGVRVGKRVTHGAGYERTAPDTADFVGIIEFEDLSGLREYLRHPAHEALGTAFHASLAGAMVYDFEMGDLESLSGLILPQL